MAIMSYRKYAEKCGVSLQAIQDRIKSGSISKNAIVEPESDLNPGKLSKIDSVVADEDFARNGDHSRVLNNAISGQVKRAPPEPEKKKSVAIPAKAIKAEVTKETVNGEEVKVIKEPYRDESSFGRLTIAKATNEELRTRKIEMEVMELERRLIDVDELKEYLEKRLLDHRAALLNMADRVALQVLGKKDLLEVKLILNKAVNDCLAGLQGLGDDVK